MLVGGLVGWWVGHSVSSLAAKLVGWFFGCLYGWSLVGLLVNGLIGFWFGGSVTWWDSESLCW